MKRNNPLIEHHRAENGGKEYPTMVIGIVPEIHRCMVFPEKDVVIAVVVVLHHNPLDGNIKLGWRRSRILENRFTQKRNPVRQLGGNEKVLFPKGEIHFVIPHGCIKVNKAPYLCFLRLGFLLKTCETGQHNRRTQ